MIRTQVYMTEDQRQQIRGAGHTLAEFVRAAIDEKLQAAESARALTLQILEKSCGLWKNRDFTGDEYQTRMRRRRTN